MKRWLRYLGFAFANADLLLELDAGQRIVFAAGAGNTLLGIPPESFLGRHLCDLLAPTCRDGIVRSLRGLAENARLGPVPVAALREDGAATVPCRLNVYRLEGGEHCFATLTRLQRDQLVHCSAPCMMDPETGLCTPEEFAGTLAAMLDAPDRSGATPLGGTSVTLLQLDNFAAMHAHMDKARMAHLMEQVGAVLRGHASQGVAGRLGTDRFGVVHDGGPGAGVLIGQDVAAATNSALHATCATLQPADAAISRDDNSRAILHVLRRFADGDRISGTPAPISSLADAYRTSAQQIQGLRSMISERRLSLHFQPIVRLDSERVHHYEALIRPHGGESPAETITFAEEVGLIAEMDLLVCTLALEALQRLPTAVRVAVNLSGGSLAADAFVEQLDTLLARHTGIGDRLLFEITESANIGCLDRASRIVHRLRSGGHPVCLDDFGMGAAQLPYLQALHVDFIKLDGSYVGRLGQNARDDALVAGLFHLARGLGIGSIAERVEDRGQALVLREMGCQYAQGWLYGRPAALESLLPLAQDHRSRPRPRRAEAAAGQ